MQLGADGVFVGSGIFKSGRDALVDHEGWAADVAGRARAIVEATTHFDDPKVLAEVSTGLGEPMVGISASSIPEAERLEVRGW
jgi:pyridoxal 5'-phosphate synthase pdxS subunit